MKPVLTPVWIGLVTTNAFLFALWVATYLYRSDPSGQEGLGFLVSYLLLPIAFLVTLATVSILLNSVFIRVTDTGTRTVLMGLSLILFVFLYGKPSVIVIALALGFFAVGYFAGRKENKDANDLKQFLEK